MTLVNCQQDVFKFADQFMDALERGDHVALRACYAKDAKLWHNFDDVEQSVDNSLKVLDWMARKLPRRHYRVIRREALADGWFQQHVLEATLSDGRAFKLFACFVIRMRDGLIIRIDEYLDPAQVAMLSNSK